jgi:hypothetical protein
VQNEEPVAAWYDHIGFELSAGGGVEAFAKSDMTNTTSTGGSWNVRGTMGANEYLALEGLYIGSAQSIGALGLSNSTLVGNGAQGDLRLNATTNYPVQPFIYGGAAWRHYNLTNSNNNVSDISNTDDVLEVPAGVGIGAKFGQFVVDARGEYRWSFFGSMVPTLGGGSANMDRWGVSGNIGYNF